MSGAQIITGDVREVLPTLDACSVDAVVTDPPYGIGFMGREWDTFAPAAVSARESQRERKSTVRTSAAYPERVGQQRQGGGVSIDYDESPTGNQRFQAWSEAWLRDAWRVAKPGAHLVVFGGVRTHHRVMAAVEDAGWEIRDCLMWLFGSGFPKSHNLRGEWDGWGTALKPAYEPIILARKPLSEGTVAANVLRWGTGAINVDGCRIPGGVNPSIARRAGSVNHLSDRPARESEAEGRMQSRQSAESFRAERAGERLGRWPANLILSHSLWCADDGCVDDCPVAGIDRQSGSSRSRIGNPRRSAQPGDGYGMTATGTEYNDRGGASRYFYCPKASRAERDAGLADLPLMSVHPPEPNGRVWDIPGSHSTPRRNPHPTVKPLALMRYLCRLITPPGGLILDPFAGSGSTGVAAIQEGFRFVGVEREPEYVEIANRRIGATA